MEFEIVIEGVPQAIETLLHLLAEASFHPVKLSSPASESYSPPLQTISLRETDPELLNRKLVRIASLIATVEQQSDSRDPLEIRVRNLGYCEPSCGSKGNPVPFKPVPSLTIRPWTSSLPGNLTPDTIILDPRHAFGTGKHPSTKLCLEILDSIAHGKWNGNTFACWNVLDFGCGTGLLAMAAVRLGAKQAVGIEIDAESAKAAKRNVSLNGLSEKIQIRKGAWEVVSENYDLILANLVPSVLFRTGLNIPKHLKSHGIAAVSGFGENLLEDMAAFFSEAGLTILERFSLKTWGALLMAPSPQSIP
ncbi:MAG: 50S ribosomal protein L11 methyltransferase [Deltaproteobacteria bacterium]|nr:50S ribosomal protein L11 methyltransferase [Deltaproteobacteria bacterium]